jgi:hypothetical protein
MIRHHVIYAQTIRREKGDLFDPRNSMSLGRYCFCHSNHHARSSPIPAVLVPDSALEFGADLMGPQRAAAYIRRYYAGNDPRLDALEAV